MSGNFLMAGVVATCEPTFLRQVGELQAQTGTGVVGMVTDWRPRPWSEAKP